MGFTRPSPGVVEVNNRFWPAGASQNAVASWGDVVFGTNPNDQTDSDGDGLSDQWELTHFNNLKQDGDDNPDGDGANNASEFGAGTNPLNANSVLKVRIASSQGGAQLSWPGALDRTYTVFRSEDLINWTPTAHNVTGSGWFESNVSLDGAFYRVEVSSGR